MRLLPEDSGTIAGTARRLRLGETTCVQILQNCLDQIDRREHEVRAWVRVDRDGALARARELDAELHAGRDRGPMHGMPIGVKDIIDVQGMPSLCGSPRGDDRPRDRDAAIVARLRAAGAVILGKTVTTAYAWVDPPVTRNPWNLDRTPGGSSSGSAAAVACGMCLGALGTQTGGSIIRPAAFCGVCGMKPSFGQLSTEGIYPLAPSLDHPGPLARNVGALRIIYEALQGLEEQPLEARYPERSPVQLVRLAGFFDDRAHAEMRWAMGAFLKWFEGWGAARVGEREAPDLFETLLTSHRMIMASEASSVHRHRLALYPEAYPPRITELIREGESYRDADVALARWQKAESVTRMLALLGDADGFVIPAAIGPAPDRSTTGDPVFQAPWSYLGFPTVCFPVGFCRQGLPLGIQLVGRPGADRDLLGLARLCESWTHDVHERMRNALDGRA